MGSKSPITNSPDLKGIKIHRVSSREELLRLRNKRGYLLNLRRGRVCLHRADCTLIKRVNPLKEPGIYYFDSIEDALRWIEKESMQNYPCKLCLKSLTYKPRPEKISDSLGT